MRDKRKLECLQEFFELSRAGGAGVDPHGHQPDRDLAFLDRLVLPDLVEKVLRRRHVERARRDGQEQNVGATHGVAQALAVQAGRRVQHQPMRVVFLQVLLACVRRPRLDGRKQGRPPGHPFARRAQWIEVGDHDALLASREPAGQVGRERRLAAATFRVRYQASSAAAPRRLLRRPSQPTFSSGRSALSLKGISSVSESAPNACPTYFDARVRLALVSLSEA